MKKKQLLLVLLPFMAAFSLAACGNNNTSKSIESKIESSIEEEEEPKPLEIGDTVIEWTSRENYAIAPLKGGLSTTIVEDFGQDDECSLKYEVKGEGHVDSDALETPYFLEESAKNGDIISAYVYVPQDSNIKSLQLQALPSSMNNGLLSDLITVDDTNEGKWIRAVVSYDTLETLGAIRVLYKTVDSTESGTFFLDKINITLGAETVQTGYSYDGESLYEAYEDYFKIGACMSSSMLRNTTLRKIAIDNFNSLTAENEGKPEQILDQSECQRLVKDNPAAVAITTKPFEKLYDFCEANHIGVRHHTFVWYSQTPGWLFTKDYTQNGERADKQLMLKRMENFIRVTLETINDRWPGLVYAIDVSNEAIENGGIRNNNNNWYSTVGEDFVYYSFLYANDYKDEDQKLYYNDFSFDYQTSNCEFALNTLLKKAIEEELIDGVGIQGHIDSNANLDNIITDAKMIYEKGLECQVTELDITINGTSEEALKSQKKAYKDLLTKMLESNDNDETNITAMVVWGINDNASWKASQNPLLFTSNYEKKPAYYGVLEAAEEF